MRSATRGIFAILALVAIAVIGLRFTGSNHFENKREITLRTDWTGVVPTHILYIFSTQSVSVPTTEYNRVRGSWSRNIPYAPGATYILSIYVQDISFPRSVDFTYSCRIIWNGHPIGTARQMANKPGTATCIAHT